MLGFLRRKKVKRLDQLGWKAYSESKYAIAEQIYTKALSVAERLGEPEALIRTRSRLGHCQQMQGRYRDAIATFTPLIEVAKDTRQVRDLPEEAQLDLNYTFGGFLDCCRFLPEVPAARQMEVIDVGLAWLERTVHGNWAAYPLRHHRALVLQRQGNFEEARAEFETALAEIRRWPESAQGARVTCTLKLTRLLREDLGRPEDALPLIDELASLGPLQPYGEWWKQVELASTQVARNDLVAAEAAARQAVVLGPTLEGGPQVEMLTCRALNSLCLATGRIDDAVRAVAGYCRGAHRFKADEYLCASSIEAARTRLLQARRACGVELDGDLPMRLPDSADLAATRRHVHSANRLLTRSDTYGRRLEREYLSRTLGPDLDRLRFECDTLAHLIRPLARGGSSA